MFQSHLAVRKFMLQILSRNVIIFFKDQESHPNARRSAPKACYDTEMGTQQCWPSSVSNVILTCSYWPSLKGVAARPRKSGTKLAGVSSRIVVI